MTEPNVAVYTPDQTESVWAYANPWALLVNLGRRRQLIGQFTQREVQGRYRGSFLGMLWAMITPLMSLLVYTFLFSVVARLQWPGGSGGFLDYALHMFSGLIAYSVFAECATRSPGLIVGNPNFVKKVVFPLEILPVSTMGSALVHSLCSLAVLLAVLTAVGVRNGQATLHWTLLLLPLAYLPLVALGLGVSWLLSSLAVFIRDIGHVIGVLIHLLFFLTPITYPIEQTGRVKSWMWFNPLTAIVDTFRRTINEGQPPHWGRWALVTAVSCAVALVGYMWFMRTKRALADVI